MKTINWQIGIALVATSGMIFVENRAIAQITPDRTLGVESSVVTPNIDIKGITSDRIDGGAMRGSALFHSFQEFNVRDGRGAYFSNPSGIENIFSRVTGGNASNIYGKLGVLGNANLFLLNPNGIVFGPNASLDLTGSFLGNTGNSFNFGNGKEFSATNPTAAPLLSVSVPLGVQFNQQQPSPIVNSGNLVIGTGQNLNLLGGTVVSTGNLSAPGGQIAIAAVPGGSVVNLSATGQFLNIDTSLPVGAGNSASLTELLTSGNPQFYPGLIVNNGQVELSGAGLPIKNGDVVVKNATAQTATFTAQQNLTLVESLIGTNGDLNLLAGDTVRIRDSAANPFVAQAGGKLLVQGRQGVDIFALNNPNSGLFSGGDLILRSLNTVGGDAHYWAGGNFRIEKLDGSLGGLFSPYDPIIRAAGNVSFDSYTGGSLHILAGGSVTINGNVEITGADANALTQTVLLSDGTTIGINGTQFPTLDIRAGVRAEAIGIPAFTPVPFPGVSNIGVPNTIAPNPPITSDTQPTSSNIQIGSIVNIQNNGQIFLTNQYQRNNDLPDGSIQIKNGTVDQEVIKLGSFSIRAYGNPVTIDSRGDVRIAQGINSSINTDGGGDIKILSRGEINVGNILSVADQGLAGSVQLIAAGNIRPGNIRASSNSNDDSGDPGTFSIITLNSSGGSVFLNNANLTTTNTGTGLAGDINIDGRNIQIENSTIESTGVNGRIFIGTESDTNTVTITNNSVVSTTNTSNEVAGDIFISGRNIQIIDTGRGNDQGIQSRGVNGRIFIGIDEQNRVTANSVTINNSRVDTQANVDSDSKNEGIQISSTGSIDIIQSTVSTSTTAIANGGNINISVPNGSLSITNGSKLSASTFAQGNAGSVTINARDKVTFDGDETTVFTNVEENGIGSGGNISISVPNGSLLVTNGAQLQALTRTRRQGDAGNIFIKADSVSFKGTSSNGQFPSGAFVRVNREAVGDAGDIDIKTGSLSVTDGARLFADTQGNGSAGNIIINATNSINISGSNSINGQPSGLFTSTTQASTGVGGKITVGNQQVPNLFQISNGAVLSASTANDKNAGDITINANRVEAINGGKLIAETTSERGAAGTITVNAGRRVTISGNPENNTGFFVRSQGSASQAGNTTSRAGDININSPIVFLDNNGRLTADSGGGDGGNINLNNGTLLLLRRNSLISTNAGTNQQRGNGGKITIDYPQGFIIAGFRRNNDIAADAFQDFGGKVTVNAFGVVNIEALTLEELKRLLPDTPQTNLNPQQLQTNNVTANSLTNPNRSGAVVLNAPNIDPTRGTIKLPENLGDSSKLIAQSCRVGVQGAGSSFVITGRGGLPPSPASALSSDTFLGSAANTSSEQTHSIPVTLQEAQGVEIGSRGQIILTARPSTLTPDTSEQRLNSCNGK